MNTQPKLTPEQQKLVSQVLPHVLWIARKHARTYGEGHDFESERVALRLCQKIRLFGPRKGD